MGCSWEPHRSGGDSSTGWCWRSTASIRAGCRRWIEVYARATGCSKCAITTTIGAMRSNAKPPNSRSRWRRHAGRRRENPLLTEPATAIEDRYREILRDSRARDAAAGRTLDGPHLTDLQVIYAPKNMPARDASTGEQKALLIGLVLAHAALVTEMTGITPLLLLDEVVAHLDPDRRTALFGELAKLGAQVWMTGADPAAFTDIGATGEIFGVDSGRISRRN